MFLFQFNIYTLSSDIKQVLRKPWGLERSACDPKCFYSVHAFELCKGGVKGEWQGGPLLTERGDLWWTLWCAVQLPMQEWRLLSLLLAVSSWLKPPSGPLALQSCLPQGHLYILSTQGWKSHPSFRTFHGVGSSHHFKCIHSASPSAHFFLPLPFYSLPFPICWPQKFLLIHLSHVNLCLSL